MNTTTHRAATINKHKQTNINTRKLGQSTRVHRCAVLCNRAAHLAPATRPAAGPIHPSPLTSDPTRPLGRYEQLVMNAEVTVHTTKLTMDGAKWLAWAVKTARHLDECEAALRAAGSAKQIMPQRSTMLAAYEEPAPADVQIVVAFQDAHVDGQGRLPHQHPQVARRQEALDRDRRTLSLQVCGIEWES